MQAEEAIAGATMPGSEAFIGFNFGEDEYDFVSAKFLLDDVQETMAATQNVPSESSASTTRRSQDTSTGSSIHRKAKTKNSSVVSGSVNFDEAFTSNIQ